MTERTAIQDLAAYATGLRHADLPADVTALARLCLADAVAAQISRKTGNLLPFRTRERVMWVHRSPGGLQRFVSMHSAIRNSFVLSARRRQSAPHLRHHRLEAFGV